MSAKRVCKVCRAEMQTQVCKFCGFKEKTIRIGDAQEGFTKVSHFNRVHRNQQRSPMPEGISSESRLKLYLRSYSRMLKGAACNLASELSLSLEDSNKFSKEVFSIWKMFLLRKQSQGFSQVGMLKKYFVNDHAGYTRVEVPKEEEGNKELKHENEQNSVGNNEDESKKLSPGSQLKEKALSNKRLTSTSKFRSFYTITLKPLLRESVEQRRSDEAALTSIQKGFVSYLLAVSEWDLPLLKVSSQKYLKLLLRIRDKVVKSYIKCQQVEHELAIRNLQLPLRKEEIAYSILLFDLLECLTQHSNCSLADMLRNYSSGPANIFIDRLAEMITREEKPQNPNIPQLSFELVYSILFLACNRSGCCVSPSEVVSGCGVLKLKVSEKEAEEIKSEENITATRVRKNAHLLASFLSLKPQLKIAAWTKKLTKQFGLEGAAPKVMIIIEVLVREAMQRTARQFQGVWLSGQRSYKYYRHPQLQQDIAVAAAILIFIKMSTGLSSYPYLLQFPVQMEGQGMKAVIISALMKQGELFVSGASLTTRLFLPEGYRTQIDVLHTCRIMHSIEAKDPLLSISAFNRIGVRLRSLSHLSSASSEQLRRIMAPLHPLEVIIKFQQASLQQLLLASIEQNRRLRGRRAKALSAFKARQLGSDVLRQLQVIMSDDESIAKERRADRSRQCQFDKPSSNYQFLLDYGEQSLRLSGRTELLHFLQLFCLNAASYSELSQWLLRLEGLLKPFEV